MSDDLHLVIANKAYSSWSLRPWIAMKANGLVFRETVICLDQPDTATKIKAHSPSGKVPLLKHGDVVVWESIAILDYLSEAFPERRWWPKDAGARARARAISAEMHGGFTNLRSNMPMNVRKSLPGVGRNEAVDKDIARIAEIWRDTRAEFGAGGAFLFGAFSNADAMYAPIVTRFKTYGVTLDPVCQAYADAMLTHPAMREWYISAAGEPWVIAKYEKDKAG
jgi:glutathione S-transferase